MNICAHALNRGGLNTASYDKEFRGKWQERIKFL